MEKWHALCTFTPGDRHQAGEQKLQILPKDRLISDLSKATCYFSEMFLCLHFVCFSNSSGQAEESCTATETALLSPHGAAACLQTSLQGRSMSTTECLRFFSKNTYILVIARYNPLYSFSSMIWFCQKSAGLQKSSLTTSTKASSSDSQSVSLSSPTHLYTSVYTHRAGGKEDKISPRIACPHHFATGQIAFSHTVFTYYLLLVKLTEKCRRKIKYWRANPLFKNPPDMNGWLWQFITDSGKIGKINVSYLFASDRWKE